jgi:hypothetical protein
MKMAKTMKLFWTTLVFVGALFTTAIGKELIVPPIHTITKDDVVIDSAFQKAEAQVNTTQQPAPTAAPSKCYGHTADGALTVYAPINGRCP